MVWSIFTLSNTFSIKEITSASFTLIGLPSSEVTYPVVNLVPNSPKIYIVALAKPY